MGRPSSFKGVEPKMIDHPDLKRLKYLEHVLLQVDAAPGVRVVQFLKLAYSKDAPQGWNIVAIYRPLNPEEFVYQKDGWDFRAVDEFFTRYRPITDAARIAECDAIVADIY